VLATTRSLLAFHHTNDYWTAEVAGLACPSNQTGHQWHAYTKPDDFNTTHTYDARDGYLGAGDDWGPARNTTLPAAQQACGASGECQGFTFRDYDRAPPAERSLHVTFKTTSEHFVPDTGVPPRDLWQGSGPAPAALLNPQPQCSGSPYPPNATGCVYEEDLFAAVVLDAVRAWTVGASPLFALWATHTAHSPYQVPQDAFDALAGVEPPARRVYHAMVMRQDAHVGALVAALRAKHMWEQTLLTFSSDNGGPITQAANNWPLRGGKHSHFEGGVRVAAFVAGGWLPAAQRGRTIEDLIAIEDWYKTYAKLGGLDDDDIDDAAAAAAGLPPIDSVDVSALLLGHAAQGTPLRTDVPLGSCANFRSDVFCQGAAPGDTVVTGVVAHVEGFRGLYKLLIGGVPLDCTTGPAYPPPDGSHASCPWRECGTQGCLFNLTHDASESHDLLAATATPPPQELVAALRSRLVAHNATTFSPNRGQPSDARACAAATERGGFWGPFA